MDHYKISKVPRGSRDFATLIFKCNYCPREIPAIANPAGRSAAAREMNAHLQEYHGPAVKPLSKAQSAWASRF